MPMNILIIGAAGGIGSKLVQDLMGTSNLLLGYYNSSLNVPVESDKVMPLILIQLKIHQKRT